MFTLSFYKCEGRDKLQATSLIFSYFTCTIDRTNDGWIQIHVAALND